MQVLVKKHFSPKEFSEITGYSMSSIYRMMHEGKLDYSRPNKGKAFIPYSEYERFVQAPSV